jgi:hypothetical protein
VISLAPPPSTAKAAYAPHRCGSPSRELASTGDPGPNEDGCTYGTIELQRFGDHFYGSILAEDEYTYLGPVSSFGGSILEQVNESLGGTIHGSLWNFDTDSNYSDTGSYSYTVFDSNFNVLPGGYSGTFSDYVQNFRPGHVPEPSPPWMVLGGPACLTFAFSRRHAST